MWNKVVHLQWVGDIITGCWAHTRFRIILVGKRDKQKIYKRKKEKKKNLKKEGQNVKTKFKKK